MNPDLASPTGPNRALRRKPTGSAGSTGPTVYRVVRDASPRRVRRGSDGVLYGEVPVVPEPPEPSAGSGAPTPPPASGAARPPREEPPRRQAGPGPEGRGRRPDPRTAATPAEFMAAMRRYHTWAGEPSCQTLQHRCGDLFAASVFREVLRGDELPRKTFVVAFITACGGGEAESQRWTTAWHRLRPEG